MAQYPTSRTHFWSPLTCRRASHYICESFVNKRGKKKKSRKKLELMTSSDRKSQCARETSIITGYSYELLDYARSVTRKKKEREDHFSFFDFFCSCCSREVHNTFVYIFSLRKPKKKKDTYGFTLPLLLLLLLLLLLFGVQGNTRTSRDCFFSRLSRDITAVVKSRFTFPLYDTHNCY